MNNKTNFEKIIRRIIEYLPKVLIAIPAFGLIVPLLFEIASNWLPETNDSYKTLYRLFTIIYFISFPVVVLLALYVKEKNRKKLKNSNKQDDYLDFIGNLKPFYIALSWITILTFIVFMFPSLFNRTDDLFKNSIIIILSIIPPCIIFIYDRRINKSKRLVNMKLLLLCIPIFFAYSFYHWEDITPKQFSETIKADMKTDSNSNPFMYQITAIGLQREIEKAKESMNLSLTNYNTENINFFEKSKIPYAKSAYSMIVERNNKNQRKESYDDDQQIALCLLYDATSEIAQQELQPIYQQTQWRGIAILLSILLILLAYRKNGFKLLHEVREELQNEDIPNWETVKESFSKNTERNEILTVICVLLIIPLLLPIQKENINIDDPAQAFKLHAWYLPSAVVNAASYPTDEKPKEGTICNIPHISGGSDSMDIAKMKQDLIVIKNMLYVTDSLSNIRDKVIYNKFFDVAAISANGGSNPIPANQQKYEARRFERWSSDNKQFLLMRNILK